MMKRLLIPLVLIVILPFGIAQDTDTFIDGFYVVKGMLHVPTFEIVVGDNPQDIAAAQVVLQGLQSYVTQHDLLVTEIGRIESSRVVLFNPSNNYIIIGTPKSNQYIEQELSAQSSLVFTTGTIKKVLTPQNGIHILISGEKPDDVLIAAETFNQWIGQKPVEQRRPKVSFLDVLRNFFYTLRT